MPKKIESTKTTPSDKNLKQLAKDLEKLVKAQEELTKKSSADASDIEKIRAEISENESKLASAKSWMDKISRGEALSAEEISNASAIGLDLSFAGEKSTKTEPAKVEKKRVSKAESSSRKILKDFKEETLQKKEAWYKDLALYESKLKEIEAVLVTGKLPAGKKLSDYKSESVDLNNKIAAIKDEIAKRDKEAFRIEAENAVGLNDKDLDAKVSEISKNAETIRAKKESDRTADEKEYLKSADAIEKEAKRRGRSAEDLAQIERLTTELKKSPIKLTEHEEKLLERNAKKQNWENSREKREMTIKAYKEKKKAQDILAAKIAVIKQEQFDENGNVIVPAGATQALIAQIKQNYENKINEWNAGDIELKALDIEARKANQGYVGMDTKIDDVKLRREFKDVHQDAENRQKRREMFAKKTAVDEAELRVTTKVRELNEKYKEFVDENGNLKVELKDVAPENRMKLEEYLIEREAISAELSDARAKRATFEATRQALFTELKEGRGRNLKTQLDNARAEYTTAYAKRYREMGGLKKWGINVFKRLGVAKGDIFMPKEIRELKNKYDKAIDADLAKERLVSEGMSEADAKIVMDRFRNRFVKFEEVKKEQEILDNMRVEAFASDKESNTRKALKWAKRGFTVGMAGLGVYTGGSSYVITKVVGMGAGIAAAAIANALLKKYWKEGVHKDNKVAKLKEEFEKDFKTGKMSPSEYDKRMQEIQRSENGAKAVKNFLVLAAAYGAAYGTKVGYQNLAEKGIAPSYENTDNPEAVDEPKGGESTGGEGGIANPPEDQGGGNTETGTEGGTDNGTAPETAPAPVEKFTLSVEVEKGQGAISMFEDLQDKLGEKYLDANGNLIDPLNTPESVAHILSVTPEELAIEHGFWDLNADAAGGNGNESALIELHATLSINQDGQLVFENPSSDPIILEDGDSSTPIEKFDGRFGDSNDPDDTHSDVNTDDREWKILDDKHEDSYEDNHNTDTRTWTIADHKESGVETGSETSNTNSDESSTTGNTKDYPPAESMFGDPTANFIEDHGNDFSLNTPGQEAFNNLVNEKMDLYFGTPDASGVENYLNDYPLLTDPNYTAQEVLDIMNNPENLADFDGSPLFEAIQNNDGILGDITPEDGEDFTHYLLRSFYEDLNDDYKHTLPPSN